MNGDEFKQRTQTFALRIIRLVATLPESGIAARLGDQLLRAGTSVGATGRAAARAKTRADFLAKMGAVEEACDAALYWMELLLLGNFVTATRLNRLMAEGREILATTVSSIKIARWDQS